jgi:hypothetical protein
MATKLTRLTHKLAIQLHLMAESYTVCSSRSRRSVRKLLDTSSYIQTHTHTYIYNVLFYYHLRSDIMCMDPRMKWDIFDITYWGILWLVQVIYLLGTWGGAGHLAYIAEKRNEYRIWRGNLLETTTCKHIMETWDNEKMDFLGDSVWELEVYRIG